MSEERRPEGSYGFGEVYLNFYFPLIKQSPRKKEGFNFSCAIYDLLSIEICQKRNRLYKFTCLGFCLFCFSPYHWQTYDKESIKVSFSFLSST